MITADAVVLLLQSVWTGRLSVQEVLMLRIGAVCFSCPLLLHRRRTQTSTCRCWHKRWRLERGTRSRSARPQATILGVETEGDEAEDRYLVPAYPTSRPWWGCDSRHRYQA